MECGVCIGSMLIGTYWYICSVSLFFPLHDCNLLQLWAYQRHVTQYIRACYCMSA
uniref:Uncharacterized protein n=1 Tax=Arundo donax TaxID=35708 RepID=A0A0A9PZS6_ARUDO